MLLTVWVIVFIVAGVSIKQSCHLATKILKIDSTRPVCEDLGFAIRCQSFFGEYRRILTLEAKVLTQDHDQRWRFGIVVVVIRRMNDVALRSARLLV